MKPFIDKWVVYPILFGIYPVLGLYAVNLGQIPPVMIVRSLLFACLLSILIFVLFRILFRSWQKAGLEALLILFLFFTYGHLYNFLKTIQISDIFLGRHRYLMVFYGLVFIVGSWLILRKKEYSAITRWLNISSALLLLFPIAQMAIFSFKTKAVADTNINLFKSGIPLTIKENATPPDIYYIILDTYTRQDTLMERFNFDNSSFISAITERGFFVADCSQSNYDMTALSLTSSLNMDYLDDISSEFLPPNTDETTLYPFLQGNIIWRLFKSMGYTRISIDTGYSPTNFTDAEVFLTQEKNVWNALGVRGLNSFESVLFQNSAGRIIYDHYKNYPSKSIFFDYAYIIYRNRMLYAMDQLGRIPSRPGPKLVFAHLLAPHNPFVFGPNGEEVIRSTPFTLNNDQDSLVPGAYVSGYTNEVVYLNKRILGIVDSILSNSTTPPIIIIQGDHGSPRMDEKLTILNAYYLPDHKADGVIYSSISPVNSFRLVLDVYFGAQLALLPDDAWFSSLVDPFNFTQEQDPNPACLIP